MEKAERNQKIIELHSQGVTLGEIGERFGISYDRVRRIVLNQKRRDEIPLNLRGLSTRSISCLRNIFAWDLCWDFDGVPWDQRQITPQMVVENCTKRQLISCPNLGKVSLKEIENWLAEHNLKLKSE